MDLPSTCLGVIDSNTDLPDLSLPVVRRALDHPADNSPCLFDIVQPGDSGCFVVSDHTRHTALDRIMPVILEGLLERGCSPADLSILIASGIHRSPTSEELDRILGPAIVESFKGRIVMHDADDECRLVSIGTTRRGQVIRINRLATEVQHLVLLGSASYHYHAGFGGGRKSLVPGIASRDAIAHTHSLTLDPNQDRIHPMATVGQLKGNPVSDEITEAALMCKPSIIVNTVLSPNGKLVGVFSGDMEAAHQAACKLVENICRVDLEKAADFVIASAEGAPNWIQAHKALFNASRAIHPEGWVILNAPCPEGLGNDRFRHWVRKRDIGEIFRELRETPEVNGQTALSSRIRGERTILVTDMNPTDVADLGIRTAPDEATAVQQVLASLGPSPTYYRMPHARHLVPFLET